MKNRRYSTRKVSTGIASIIIGLSVWKIGTVNAATNSNISTSSKVIMDKILKTNKKNIREVIRKDNRKNRDQIIRKTF